MLQRLILCNPDNRLTIKQIKKHPFFKSVDWKQVAEGKLKMPFLELRPVSKSKLPFNFNDDFSEDGSEYDRVERYSEDQKQRELPHSRNI